MTFFRLDYIWLRIATGNLWCWLSRDVFLSTFRSLLLSILRNFKRRLQNVAVFGNVPMRKSEFWPWKREQKLTNIGNILAKHKKIMWQTIGFKTNGFPIFVPNEPFFSVFSNIWIFPPKINAPTLFENY